MLTNIYECENCGGTFEIIPDTDEEILYCPQCSDKRHFKSTDYQIRDDKFYD